MDQEEKFATSKAERETEFICVCKYVLNMHQRLHEALIPFVSHAGRGLECVMLDGVGLMDLFAEWSIGCISSGRCVAEGS